MEDLKTAEEVQSVINDINDLSEKSVVLVHKLDELEHVLNDFEETLDLNIIQRKTVKSKMNRISSKM